MNVIYRIRSRHNELRFAEASELAKRVIDGLGLEETVIDAWGSTPA